MKDRKLLNCHFVKDGEWFNTHLCDGWQTACKRPRGLIKDEEDEEHKGFSAMH